MATASQYATKLINEQQCYSVVCICHYQFTPDYIKHDLQIDGEAPGRYTHLYKSWKLWFWVSWHLCFHSCFKSVSADPSRQLCFVSSLGGTDECREEQSGLGWDSFKRKGRALSREHMKGQVCHLGALMTDCVSLFWLEISFNMHDKRRPSGTLPTNRTASRLQTPAVSALHRFIISGSYLMARTGIPDWMLTCAVKSAKTMH